MRFLNSRVAIGAADTYIYARGVEDWTLCTNCGYTFRWHSRPKRLCPGTDRYLIPDGARHHGDTVILMNATFFKYYWEICMRKEELLYGIL